MKRLVNCSIDDKLQEAIDLINDFCEVEYGAPAIDENSDLSDIGILYTTDGGNDEVEVQITIDLKNPAMKYYINNELRHTDKYKDLQDLIDSDLEILDFNDLFSYAVRFAKKSDYDPEVSPDYIERRKE